METVAQKALAAYGFTDLNLQPPEAGYRNTSFAAQLPDGEFINLIIYKDEAGIQARILRANTVGNTLAAAGLPTRQTRDARMLAIKTPASTRFASLYSYLPGATIPWEGYTKHHIKLLGQAMGSIHAAALSMPGTPHVADEYQATCERMAAYFAEAGVQTALTKKLRVQPLAPQLFERFEQILAATTQLPGQRMLHMDLVRGNVLFAKPGGGMLVDGPVELSGILDFEKTACGHPVFDLARTLAFLLVDCKYKSADKIEKYFLHSGYAKRGHGAVPRITLQDSTDLLHELTSLFLLHDFYKFLRHNPYESLANNEHYVRTLDILVARRTLETL